MIGIKNLLLALLVSILIVNMNCGVNNGESIKRHLRNLYSTNTQDYKSLIGSCMQGIQESLDPAFCWKKSSDIDLSWGTKCDAGFTKRFFSCVQDCKSGYDFQFGMCKRGCQDGYKLKAGLICYKSFFHWYFPNGYIPSRAWASCDKGYSRLVGDMCSKSCEWAKDEKTGELMKTTMKNCGPLACANSTMGCIKEVINLAYQTIHTVVQFMAFVETCGASGAADVATKAATKAAVHQAGESAVKKALKIALKQMTDKAKAYFKRKVIEYVKRKFPNFIPSTVEQVCNAVVDNVSDKKDPLDKFIADITGDAKMSEIVMDGADLLLDIFGTKEIIDKCTDKLDSSECIKSIIAGVGTWDPTGIITLISTFVKPICQLDFPDYNNENDVKVQNTMTTVPKGCVRVFEHCNFKGESKDFCPPIGKTGVNAVVNVDKNWNDKMSSIITGKETFAVFFQHVNNKGRSFSLNESAVIPCLLDLKIDDMSFNDMISSINFDLKNCGTFQIQKNNDENTWSFNEILCKGMENTSLNYNLTEIKTLKIETFTEEIRVVIFEKENFQGKSVVLEFSEELTNEEIIKKIGFNVIGSYKIADMLSLKKYQSVHEETA